MSHSLVRMITLCSLCLALSISGCTSYYRVTDPASGKTYYTTEVKETGRSGAVKVMDAKTGSTVTLQSSEVKEISEEEYKAGLAAQPAPQK